MKALQTIALLGINVGVLIWFAFQAADFAAAHEGSPWRWIYPVFYALLFRVWVNPIVEGFVEHRKKHRKKGKS